MADGYYSFKDFSFNFDTISLSADEETSPQNRYLTLLSDICINGKNYVLDSKIKFVFPMFYHFAKSEQKKEVKLYSEKSDKYEWLIEKEIEEDVKKHSAYGLGIAESYCKSEVGPSYIEIKQSDTNNSMETRLFYYNDLKITNAQIKIYEDNNKEDNKNKVERKILTYIPEVNNYELPDLNKINILNPEDDPLLNKLFKDDNFKDGIKSHWPIVGGDHNKNKFLYYFFTNNLKIDKHKSQGIGGVFVISYGRLTRNEIGFFVLSGYTLANKVALYQMQKKALSEAVKSAKAAIMSRNMSHNLGSHVMFYIKQRLESVEKILQTGALHELIKSTDIQELKEKIQKKIIQTPGEELPFLVGLGRFLNYLQERQDFIATVATDYIPYKSTINFKDAIYDELKPELRYERHHKSGYDNSIVGKQASNLLFDYIAYSEGFTSSEQIELLFEDFNGKGDPSEVPTNLRHFNVALPGGNLGRQALFSIMENIIRNTAKHDGSKLGINKDKKIGFRFDQINYSEIQGFYSWTNKDVYQFYADKIEKIYEDCSNDFYFLGITIDVGQQVNIQISNILESIGNGLSKRYLNDDGTMNEDCKGIKEIRISAAWMRGYGIDTDIPADEPPAVAIRDNGGKLQYIICLPKPKKVAIVGNESRKLSAEGLQYFSSDELTHDNIKRMADFDLIVCSEKDRGKLRRYVGSRVLTKGNINADTENNAVEGYYMEWLYNTYGECLPTLVINDEKAYENKHIYKYNNGELKENEIAQQFDSSLFSKQLVESNSSDSTSNQIVYAKHYEGQDTLKEMYKDAKFLEGVSGGNSTDRLIRQEKWTKEWYVKQMTAGLTKVAIFDERIFGSFVRRGQNTEFASWDEDKLGKWLEELLTQKQCHGNKIDSGVLSDELKKQFNDLISINDVGDEDDNLYVSYDKAKYTDAIKKIKKSVTLDKFNTAELYTQKGIWVFDISSENKVVTIKGFSTNKKETVDVATIKKLDESTIKCDMIDHEFDNKFDFITIHQGILDKIYETLGIKGNEYSEKKKEVTSEIFGKFSAIDNKKEKDGFLPQFIIHSGRSRPTKHDMPQEQPFIQFSALDHAIRDCKYTLTELLYSAHYE